MAFITQRAKTRPVADGSKLDSEIHALEALVSGVNQISQSTLLLKKKKEMHEVDDALDFMKEEYKQRVEASDQRQRKFEKRQADMKEQVAKFEKFIQENDSKRQRAWDSRLESVGAEIKAKGEHRMLDQKETEQKRQTVELEKLERDRAQQIAQLNKLRRYKEYLERTVESAEDETAEEIWDLLNRHTTLRNANLDLMDQVQLGDAEMDELRAKMDALKLKTSSAALVQNSQIHAKQKHLEALRALTKKHDDQKLTHEERVKDVTRETAQIILAVRNLYGRCIATMRTRVVPIDFSDDAPDTPAAEQLAQLGTCLDLIRERLNDLGDMLDKSVAGHSTLVR